MPVKTTKRAVAAVAAVVRAQTDQTRAPKIWWVKNPGYGDDFDYSKAAFQKHHKKMQVGDMIAPKDGYRGNDIYLIDTNGELVDPIILVDAGFGLPAWMFEVGIKNGHTMQALVNIYKPANPWFYIYPKSQQNGHLKYDPDGKITSFRMNHIDYGDVVLPSEDIDWDSDDFELEYELTMDKVFIKDPGMGNNNFVSNVDQSIHLCNGLKGLDAKIDALLSKTLPLLRELKTLVKGLEKPVAKASACQPQTTKKYLERPSPPFLAAECPGKVKLGNNGLQYRSVANKNGVYSWKKVAT